MLSLSDIRDYLETMQIAEHYYVGKLDNKQKKAVGVYQRPPDRYVAAFGGRKIYNKRSVSILIHWNKSVRETEEHAFSVFEQLTNIRNATMGNTLVYYAIPQMAEPQDVGTDDAGVYEQVIWMDFYYRYGTNDVILTGKSGDALAERNGNKLTGRILKGDE